MPYLLENVDVIKLLKLKLFVPVCGNKLKHSENLHMQMSR